MPPGKLYVARNRMLVASLSLCRRGDENHEKTGMAKTRET